MDNLFNNYLIVHNYYTRLLRSATGRPCPFHIPDIIRSLTTMPDTRDQNIHYPDLAPSSAGADQFSLAENGTLDLINRKIAGLNSLVEVVDFLFKSTQDLFPCDRIGVAFLEEGGRRLRLHYVTANYEPLHLAGGYSADLDGSSLAAIFRNSTPRIINDLSGYAVDHPGSESTAMLLKEGVRSSMTCPLLVDGRPVGVMFRSSKKPAAYTEHHVILHNAIAERFGQAVEKAYRIEQLSDAINSYMEMLGFVSHELKSPLASIITLATTFRDGYFGAISEEHRAIVDRIIKKAEYLHNLSAEYLNLSRFESGKMNIYPKETMFIAEVIMPSIDIIAPQISERKVNFIRDLPPGDLKVFCDPELLKIVMVNLLGNSVKYGNIGGAVKLAAAAAGETIRVSVWNEGPGFGQDQKKHLFRKFSRLDSPDLMQRKGSGIGLYVTWNILVLHGGRIRADSEKGKWAEFSFELPVRQKAPAPEN